MRFALAVGFLLVSSVVGAQEAAKPNGGPIFLPPGPPTLIMKVKLGTGTTSRVSLDCVNADGSKAILPSACSFDNVDPLWRVRRCDAEGCDFAFPVTMESDTEISFPNTGKGTYYIMWQNATSSPTRTAGTVLQRGPTEYPHGGPF